MVYRGRSCDTGVSHGKTGSQRRSGTSLASLKRLALMGSGWDPMRNTSIPEGLESPPLPPCLPRRDPASSAWTIEKLTQTTYEPVTASCEVHRKTEQNILLYLCILLSSSCIWIWNKLIQIEYYIMKICLRINFGEEEITDFSYPHSPLPSSFPFSINVMWVITT